ncbi:MAG: 23S rRNA (pseudouridine(1915)-N(3))-methyltransferase RlmH [Chitinophagales bacterium]|nr:23S rRNA (pseudouridine(1915)-N(3))-methyltransferase RlmH [Chitinophagales bacterium]MDW8273230.1 23S rRNA (pseudouridine(1915)-N(3))-methyltransferase RlmH [Chitinophagales bacterium]
MKIRLILFGDTASEPLREWMGTYEKRINHFISFRIEILKNTNPSDEGTALLKRLEEKDFLILLDEKGKEFTSKEFAVYLEKLMASSGRDIVFCIGGAYGFSKTVYERSNSTLSLSKMTMPHQLIRLVFIEQLYRAFTIIRNQPYHH